ncbi:MAG: hypothetical protein IT306_28725 [Chloroflexi bacterium]|nr:hypothetical protein [Chloroflexota bacterium]
MARPFAEVECLGIVAYALTTWATQAIHLPGRLHVDVVVPPRRGLKAPPTILQSLCDAPVAPVPAVPDGRRCATA